MFKNQEKLLQIVRECVNTYDPETLLKVGAPSDEYEPEIKAIAHELRPTTTRMQAWLIVCNTLAWYFHPHDVPTLYWNRHYELSDAIVARLSEVDTVEAQET